MTEFPDPLFGVHTEHSRVSYILLHELIHATWPQRYQSWHWKHEIENVRSDMPAGRSEYDLTIAVHAFDDAYKELIHTINQDHRRTKDLPKEKKSVQESVPRMVTISLVNRGITSAKCLSIFEYYLYSAYLESMRKDIRTAYDHILISRFQNTLRQMCRNFCLFFSIVTLEPW